MSTEYCAHVDPRELVFPVSKSRGKRKGGRAAALVPRPTVLQGVSAMANSATRPRVCDDPSCIRYPREATTGRDRNKKLGLVGWGAPASPRWA